MEAPKGRGSSSVTISNPTQQPVRIQLSLSAWEMTDESKIIIKDKDESKGSVIDFVKMNPRQFTIEPFKKRVIRIAAAIPPNFEDGEYRLLLNILEIGAQRKKLNAPEKFNFGLIINRQVSAGTYVRKGNPANLDSDLNIKSIDLKRDGNKINYTITYQNNGNIHTRRSLGVKYFDNSGLLIAEKKRQGGFLAIPTINDTSRSYSSGFAIPDEILKNKDAAQLEFTFIDEPLGDLGRKESIKSEMMKF
ncbi:MAG: hypothetical protein QNJ31_07270 [Candidatus Caenarcaniphilales bacterium]|nr:hypothetical protein [Candidatus Caenarcaniphilales bacterium]